MRRIAVFHFAVTVLFQLPALALGAPRPYWVCVGADGERMAQDRPCIATERTVRAEPDAISMQPVVSPSPAVDSGIELSRTHVPASAQARPNPFKAITDTAVHGLSTIAVILLIIGAIKVLLIKATKSDKPERQNRRSRGPSIRKASMDVHDRYPASRPSWERYGTAPAPLVRTEQSPTPVSIPVTWSIDLIRELEWKRFEELCAQFWSIKGYPARLSGPGADGGVDVVIADHRDPGRAFAVAQCKSWTAKPVGVEPVRALWGAKDHFKANLALFYGLSGFTPDAHAFAEGKHLKLISGEALLQQIMAMPEEDRTRLLTAVTRGDYTTPTCPKCDTKMSRRPGKDGKPDFWGCNNFRRCGARPIPCRR